MNFALIGAAGFVAPRHMRAIKETGGNLIAILDKSDSVGAIDSYFPDAHFFTEFEIFDRHLQLLKRSGVKIDYLVVCTPNYLHDAHIRYGLLNGMDVICEKPLVINYHNIAGLKELEKETGRRVWNILQLRLSPALKDLDITNNHVVELIYHTPRGNWYEYSWKGDKSKSGGIMYNIGIHFFDLLIFLFGEPTMFKKTIETDTAASGVMHFANGYCRWSLTVECDVPIRILKLNNKQINLTDGFNDAHTRSYEEILDGRGFGLQEAEKAIKLLSV